MFRALQPPQNALSPHAASAVTSTTIHCRRPCLLFPRSVTAKRSHCRSFAVKSTTSFGDYFGFPFAKYSSTQFGHGVFSKVFSTRVAGSGNQKERSKAVLVRGKENDESVISDDASIDVDNVASGKSLGDEKKGSSRTASGKEEDAKTAKKKTVKKKKKPSLSKKVSAASISAQEECVAEVSGKSSKGKKKKVSKNDTNTVVIQKSSIESATEETQDNSASVEDVLKKRNGNSSLIEETKPLWNFTYKPLYPPSGKSVVVVESVTKAKVIKGYLGDMYEVLPSYGHVRDLAARSGSVRPDEDFSMVWEVPSPAWTHLKSINVALSGYIFPPLTPLASVFGSIGLLW
ncbi:unnamed protein product [Sphenostylis stenocarpa]|uniref:DNA topoisomerase I n=1 Tax=Sphenostylis stenocarpa TaxID=92480 RepID=A0AA86VNY9_9FABA|nr:unnamed protein product [Sphenostylis stenocarpa]